MRNFPAEPCFLNPIYKEKIWGGTALQSKLNKSLPYGKQVGESWELCGFGVEQSVLNSGVLAGETLGNLYTAYRDELVNGLSNPEFPILLKFLDPQQKLSVQIHPDKTECWYVVDAKDGALINIGFKQHLDKTEIYNAIQNGILHELLNYIPVKRGDVLYVPAGTVHAVLDGTLIYEIQEPSDTTFRLYDWGRTDSAGVPRELHIEQSIEIVDTTNHNHLIDPIIFNNNGYTHSYRVATRFFSIEEYKFSSKSSFVLPEKKYFRILTAIDGVASLHFSNGSSTLKRGQTLLIPAVLEKLTVEGDAGTILLCSTFPDLEKDIIQPLLKRDISPSLIKKLAGDKDSNDLSVHLHSRPGLVF
jgi:mannose-6-phosphate isomerase